MAEKKDAGVRITEFVDRLAKFRESGSYEAFRRASEELTRAVDSHFSPEAIEQRQALQPGQRSRAKL